MKKFKSFLSKLDVSLVIFTLILVGAAFVYYLSVRKLPHPESNLLFIGPCFFAILFCGIIIIAQEIIRANRKYKTDNTVEEPIIKPDAEKKVAMLDAFLDKNKTLILIVFCVLYLLIYKQAGFIISTFLFLSVVMYLIGVADRKIVKILVISLATALILYLSFAVALQVKLPKGLLKF